MTHRPWAMLACAVCLLAGAGAVPGKARTAAEPEATPAPAPVSHHASLAAAREAAAHDEAPILVVFTARWSGPSRTLTDMILFDASFTEQAGPLHVVTIDVNHHPALATRFEITTVPALVLMTRTHKVLDRRSGVLSAQELSEWLRRGRERMAYGEWLGAASLTGAQDLPVGLPELIQCLGDRDPAQRSRVIRHVLQRREAAVPYLLQAAEDPYLGVRVGACEVLKKLAPDAPAIDPWAPAEERDTRVTALTKWWQDHGELSDPGQERLDHGGSRDLEDALADALSGDTLRRTRGMGDLVRIGRPALARIRQAIKACAQTDDREAMYVLEDVRWAILVPDRIEAEVHVRRDLARGATEAQRRAALRLAGAGRDALPALKELVNQTDPLVREAAIHALQGVGGQDALDAMAVLLDARESNLRMVAAQALGKCENRAAADYLVKAIDDPDEVVACAAIAALEEVGAKDKGEELTGALKDERWRVRAAAVEALGNMEITSAAAELKNLLDDPDPFVVRKTLAALRRIEVYPSRERFLGLVESMPNLTRTVVEFIAERDDRGALALAETIYDQSEIQNKRAVLDGLRETYNQRETDDSYWTPLLRKAADSDDAALRRKLVAVLDRRSIALCRQFLSELLQDPDEEVRSAAAGQVLRVAAYDWGVFAREEAAGFGVLARVPAPPTPEAAEEAEGPSPSEQPEAAEPTDERVQEPAWHVDETEQEPQWEVAPEEAAALTSARADRDVAPASTQGRANGPLAASPDNGSQTRHLSVLRELGRAVGHALSDTSALADIGGGAHVHAWRVRRQHQAWHVLLAPHLEKRADLRMVLAHYVPGDGRAGLDRLRRVLEGKDLAEQFEALEASAPMGVVLRRLPWPEGKPILQAAADRSFLYARMLGQLDHARAPARALLFQPDRVVRAVSTADPESLNRMAQTLVNRHMEYSLHRSNPTNDRVLEALCKADNPAARSLGVFVYGMRKQREALPVIIESLMDENPWVRRAAVQGVIECVESREEREPILAPLLSYEAPENVALAATGLLTAAFRDALSSDESLRYFRYEDMWVWVSPEYSYYTSTSSPPLRPLSESPGFLPDARARLAADDMRDEPAHRLPLILLLAQYGDFSGLERELHTWRENREASVPEALLLGLRVTRDPKYLPPLRARLAKADNEIELRQLLQYLRGVRGPEARELRREVNDRLRGR